MTFLRNVWQQGVVLCIATLVAGCMSSLPFPHTVTSIIPDELKIKGVPVDPSSFNYASAKAYAVNDKGHVAGIYSPPAPRNGDQIFIFADGKLSRYDHPCQGYLYVKHITNTGLIAGTCQPRSTMLKPYSFVSSYESQVGTLQAVKPAWPTQGFFVSGLNDRGDAVGWNPDVFGGSVRPVEFLGFIYVSGRLHMVRRSELPAVDGLFNSRLNSSGLVVGGKSDRVLKGQEFQEIYPFMFTDGKFVGLPSNVKGKVVSVNGVGQWLTEAGHGFGLYDGQFRIVGCDKDWCVPSDINDQGWVVGNRHTSYPIPPLGASFGDAYLWMGERFYSINNSTHLSINQEYPLKLSNQGHILFHSDGWPYLLTPEVLSKSRSK